jgi:hypothetical protein
MAGKRRALDDTRAYVAQDKWRGMARSTEIMQRASFAAQKRIQCEILGNERSGRYI